MTLLNQSLKYLSFYILAIVTLWAVVFYVSMLGEIKSSIDEGLENHKHIIIQNARTDPSILSKGNFDENFFTIRKIDRELALDVKDQYIDTIIDMQDADDEEPEPEPVRMLISAFETNGEYYELIVANSMVEEDDLVKELFWNVIWLYLLLMTGIVLVNNFVLKRLWRPFYTFLNQLKNYRLGGTQNLPQTNTRTREFQDLQKAVTTLMQHTIAAFEQQKEFIGNASHELQTPLAMVTNKLELLLEKDDLKKDHAEKIAEIFQIIERMVRLNKSLLLLSKIENKQFFDDQQVSINEIVKQTINDLEPVLDFKEVEITLSEAMELSVHMDAMLANIVVSNLLKNAIFHNVKNGTADVRISGGILKICNTGRDQRLDRGKMFDRFQKHGSEAMGTGLGLAIVKAITDLYGFPVSYTFNNKLHCFEVRFSPN